MYQASEAVEGHFILFVCGYGCGCMTSSWNSVSAHINMQHPSETVAMVHVDKDNWISIHQLIPGLAPTMLRLPLRKGGPLCRWSPSRTRRRMSPPPGKTFKPTIGSLEIQLAIEEVQDKVRGVQTVIDIMGLILKGIIIGLDLDPKGNDSKDLQQPRKGSAKDSGALQIPEVCS